MTIVMSANVGPSRAFSLPPSRSASALPRSEQPTRHLESEQSRKGPSPSLRRPTAKEGSPHARLLQSSADQSTGGDSTQKASQFASHSRLVRPKVRISACPAEPRVQILRVLPKVALWSDSAEQHGNVHLSMSDESRSQKADMLLLKGHVAL